MIVALAGHVDHGKTALIRALTGIDADRLPEEQRRGMTIDLGFAHTRLPSGTTVGFVDVPGHERFLTNMLAGVLGLDRVLLVVAADDGPMPQTREHLAILRLTGVSDIVAVLSKIDRVDAGRRAAARAETRAVLDRSGFAAAPILEASSATGEGVSAVRAHIEAAAAAHRARDTTGRFRLAIDRSFSPTGAGLVVTGTVASGVVSVGDRLLLSPSHLAARVRGIQVHHDTADQARAGDRCALAIAGPRIERARLRRGDWLIDPSLHAPTTRIDALLRAADDRGPRHAARVRVHLGTGSMTARALMHDARDLAAGQDGFVTLTLDAAVACLHGDRVVLRDESTGRVVAGGHVVDPFSPARRVRREARAISLRAHSIAAPEASFHALLAAEGWADPRRFALARNLPDDFAPKLPDGAIRLGAMLISPETIERATGDLVRYLRSHHETNPDRLGPGKAELARAAPGLSAEIAEAVMEDARARGVLVRDGLAWRLPDHRPVLSGTDEAAWSRIEPMLRAAGPRPPRLRELAETLALEPAAMDAVLQRLTRFGRLARVAANRYFLPETVVALGALARTMEAESENGGFTAAEFNKQSEIGRNLTIEVLEYLDSIGVTRRTGDLRHVVRPADAVLG